MAGMGTGQGSLASVPAGCVLELRPASELRGGLKYSELGHTPRVLNEVDLGWDLRIRISDIVLGNSDCCLSQYSADHCPVPFSVLGPSRCVRDQETGDR